MSGEIQFWKLKLFAEEVTENFPAESIHESIKLLLRGTEQHSQEYIKKYFEGLSLDTSPISADELKKIIPDVYTKPKYPLFDPKKITFFMMDEKTWAGIEQILERRVKEALSEEEQKLANRLQSVSKTIKDYDVLSDLFSKKLLFVNTF